MANSMFSVKRGEILDRNELIAHQGCYQDKRNLHFDKVQKAIQDFN